MKQTFSRFTGPLAALAAGAALSAAARVTVPAPDNLADFALPIVGTDNTPALSNGNVYPDISLPWGEHSWTPQTGRNDSRWIYNYGDGLLRGIRQTHQPSPWIGDYGAFSLLPATGLVRCDDKSRETHFSHKTETVRPYEYAVYLADFDVTVELAPTPRAAVLRATYPETDAPQFVVDAFAGGAITRVDPRGVIEGVSRQTSSDRVENRFVVTFDRPFATNRVEGALALVAFAPMRRGERVTAKVASSFVSTEQARLNLREVGARDFEAVRAEGRAAWNRALGRIVLAGTDPDRARMFYTCLYRALLFPRRFYDLDANGRPVHTSPHTLEVRPGPYFCDTGFWDTFRSLFPLLNFLYPEMNREITEGLLNCYDEGGWLPEWSSPGYRHSMIGNNSASVVADAILSGAAAGCDAERLYKAVVHGANNAHPDNCSLGRAGAKDYLSLGYVPRDCGLNESAARTLEYAYDDWCILMLARHLGRPPAETEVYAKRCGNWRNVFDARRGLACGRNRDGTFDANFNPYKWGGDFTEGNALHYTWSVFHDIAGLIGAMGGREKFNARLDSIFELPPVFDESAYGSVIHEIREMQIMGFGQYAHGNQPIQHMIYLYGWSGQPWKAQKRVNEVCRRLYRPAPDGYCGDEDNGQTSAWYVWSSLGFYPVCPGSGEYALGAPQVAAADLAIGPATLRIRATDAAGRPADADRTPYVDRVTLNGRELDRNYVTRAELVRGGDLVFTMAEKPNLRRGTTAAAAPYSFSRDEARE